MATKPDETERETEAGGAGTPMWERAARELARLDEEQKAVWRELKEARAAAGLGLTVVNREDPIEVRIPPPSVVLDFTRGQAELRFARLPLATCGANAGDIVLEHRATMAALDGPFDPKAFFERCWSAYGAACAAAGEKRGERVEIRDFLPHLTLLLQSKKFKTEPTAAAKARVLYLEDEDGRGEYELTVYFSEG